MDRKSLNTLEYPKVLEQLALFTAFSASKALVRGLRPTDDIKFACVRQARTGEACRLLSENSDVSIGGARDVRQQVQLADRGGVLTAEELLDIKATLISGRDLFRFFDKLALDLPHLKEIASVLNPPEGLIEAITRVFDDKGEIKDSASEKLSAIRSDLKRATARVLEKLNNLINTPSSARMLQEPIITKRADRYVVPLRAEYKGRMKCVVQDQSASGATLFVEPLPIVELNNDRIASAMAEKEEIHRILAELSAQIGERMGQIQEIVHQLAVLDLAFACAKYAFSLKAVEPILVPFPGSPDELPDPIIRFMNARHPLLDQDTVVPMDIYLDKGTHALVITGPNTGGKTISLKTAGLMVLMAQSGMHIPAQSGSQLCVFKNVFADIGDEQSIEQSLSTFSGHVTNIVRILKKSNRSTLILFDELGAGTDPQEGSALARAIMTYLIRRRVPALVATHYPELKAFAHASEGILNASVEFDRQSLMPTYRLLIGIPGRSNALAIAGQLGIPEEILKDAREMIDPENLQTDSLLDEIHHQLDQARGERARAETLRVEIEEENDQLQARLAAIEEERMAILESARSQAADEAEKLYAEISSIRRQAGEPKKTIQKKKELRKQVNGLIEKIDQPIEKQRRRRGKARPLRIGDRVYIRRLDMDAVVTSFTDDEVEVEIGKMRMKVDIRDVERSKVLERAESVSRSIEEQPGPAKEIYYPSPGAELNLIGKRVDDALMALDRYLDSAQAAGLPYVRIVHGKGTGALRQAVREALGDTPSVERWELALDNEGGEGVTIAFLTGN